MVIKINLIEALEKQIIFCKENREYNCGIYVSTQIKREIIMEVISNLLPVQNVNIKLKSGVNESFVQFANGNIIKVVQANSGARGNRFNGMIIDSEVSKKVVDIIILPCLKPIFVENRYDNNDNPTDRMHFCDITQDDVIESVKYKPILYASARGSTNSARQFKEMMEAIVYGYSIKSVNYDENIFKKEYKCMFYENDYDRPVVEKELNSDKVMLYEAWGIPKDLITYSTEFVNKTKKTYLNITGKYEMPELGFENDINIHLHIDTNIYDGYEVHVEDGLVTVVLHEIKNKAPMLKDYGVAQKRINKSDTSCQKY